MEDMLNKIPEEYHSDINIAINILKEAGCTERSRLVKWCKILKSNECIKKCAPCQDKYFVLLSEPDIYRYKLHVAFN